MARIFVGMSGGVDSSVTAALLAREGHDVTGITLTLLPEGDTPGACCGTSGAADARAVCDTIGIPHYSWNARDAFAAEVVGPFIASYAAGRTPNPCIACNDRIKFVRMLSRAMAAGAHALATGHYARIVEAPEGRRVARGLDPAKDQSYFLYRMTDEQMARTLFPLGELTKADVRAMAREWGLPTAETPESQETCFAPGGHYAPLIGASCPEALAPGDIVDSDGRILGRHDGIARYTIGQRKGLGLAGGPWFVTAIEPATSRIVVGREADLAVTRILASVRVWLGAERPTRASAAIRYRAPAASALVTPDPASDALLVELDTPVAGVAPGQAVVVYDGDLVVGGGVVSDTA